MAHLVRALRHPDAGHPGAQSGRTRTHHVGISLGFAITYRLGVRRDVGAAEADDDLEVPYFLVEIHLHGAGRAELSRAVRLLEAAQSRFQGTATTPVVAGFTREDSQLVCLIEATSVESARRVVRVALLPAGRIREVTNVMGTGLLRGGYPRGDADARVEAELVEDVVDVRLDGPLGQE